jgi:hypothetical protein
LLHCNIFVVVVRAEVSAQGVVRAGSVCDAGQQQLMPGRDVRQAVPPPRGKWCGAQK